MSDEADRLESDPGALAVARRLAAADFAKESRVRKSLRARLLSRQSRPALLDRLFPLRLPAGLAAACAAAVIFLIVVRPRLPAPPPAPAPVPIKAAPAPTVKALPPAGKRPATRGEGVFVSIAAASPFETHGKVAAGHPFVTVPGRRTRDARGKAVVWELEHATFRLEERPVSIAELFVKPTL